jgi:ribosomal protein S8
VTTKTKYDFSYTGFSLRVNEMARVARAQLYGEDFDAVKEIGGGKTSTTKKFLNEINKRLGNLTNDELELLVNGLLSTQKQIAFLSMCKAHGFISDFVIEVMREKILVFDDKLTEGDYLTFFRRKCEEHPELESLEEVSQKKIRQVMFRSLEEAGWISNTKERVIQHQILDDKLIKAVTADNPIWLKIFFVSDLDIMKLTN